MRPRLRERHPLTATMHLFGTFSMSKGQKKEQLIFLPFSFDNYSCMYVCMYLRVCITRVIIFFC